MANSTLGIVAYKLIAERDAYAEAHGIKSFLEYEDTFDAAQLFNAGESIALAHGFDSLKSALRAIEERTSWTWLARHFLTDYETAAQALAA